MSPVAAIYLVWGLWFIAWLGATVVARREPGALHGGLSAAFHIVAAAAILMLLTIARPFPGTDLQYRLWAYGVSDELGWVLVALTVAGFGFSNWASVHRIAHFKQGERLVTGGPYAVVRHPIYLGAIVAAIATALVFGQPTSLAGAVVLAVALIVKVHLEERATHNADYRAYCSRVPMFVPFWPMGESDETSPQA